MAGRGGQGNGRDPRQGMARPPRRGSRVGVAPGRPADRHYGPQCPRHRCPYGARHPAAAPRSGFPTARSRPSPSRPQGGGGPTAPPRAEGSATPDAVPAALVTVSALCAVDGVVRCAPPLLPRGGSQHAVTADWVMKQEPVPVDVARDGGWHRGASTDGGWTRNGAGSPTSATRCRPSGGGATMWTPSRKRNSDVLTETLQACRRRTRTRTRCRPPWTPPDLVHGAVESRTSVR